MKVVDQNIPSELLFKYSSSLQPSTLWKPGSNIYVVNKRKPFILPHMRSDSGNSPSGAQLEVRTAFNKCVDCFNNSPKTGGATPPDIGYRSREWWHNAAGGSGLWYYDYFIQQTWQEFFDGGVPDWCTPTKTYIFVSPINGQYRNVEPASSEDTPLAAWNAIIELWNNKAWANEPWAGIHIQNYLYETNGGTKYEAIIYSRRAKLTIDLTAYNPNDYKSAYLVVKPRKFASGSYYCDQGWVENEYKALKDMLGELGSVWTSTPYYAPSYTPSQPPEPTPTPVPMGYWADFYIALIPKT